MLQGHLQYLVNPSNRSDIQLVLYILGYVRKILAILFRNLDRMGFHILREGLLNFHPVGAGGKDIGGTMSEKVTNDMVAQVKSIAEKRGRNVKWVEKAVRESVSVTETEALKLNVIDIVAKDLDDLIRAKRTGTSFGRFHFSHL